MEQLKIVEVSPRDGLQNEARLVSTSDKVHLIESAAALGVDRIEVASFVSKSRVPQMADAEDVISRLSETTLAKSVGLVLNAKGLERALATGLPEVNIVVSATEAFAKHNQNSTRQQLLEDAQILVETAHHHNLRASVTISVAFGCPYEGNVPMSAVVDAAVRVASSNPDEIVFADTIGAAVPIRVKELISEMSQLLSTEQIRFHFHDTRATGLANAWAAFESGVHSFDTSIGGIGGCPYAPGASGNLATEDLVWMMKRSGLTIPISEQQCLEVASFIAACLGKQPYSRLWHAGPFPEHDTI